MKVAVALVAAALLLAGCTESDDGLQGTPTSAAPTTAEPVASTATPSQKPEPAGPVVMIVIKDGKVTPQGKRVEVKAGQQVTLSIVSDVDEEIHVHSEPEHTYEVTAGTPVTESFTVDNPGQVAVEAHELGVTIVQLVVRP